jgi:prepilin-type N-terminal cleavage/methylation domain-containing protein
MKKGFTLIELMLVIAIIAVLIGILLPVIGKARCRASEGAANTYIKGSLEAALAMYRSDYGAYPKSDENFSSKVLYEELTQPKSTEDKSPYMEFRPENLCEDKRICTKDKWPYFYVNNDSQNRGKTENLVGKNPRGVDIWTVDCDYLRKNRTRIVNGCYAIADPEEVKKTTRVKNW